MNVLLGFKKTSIAIIIALVMAAVAFLALGATNAQQRYDENGTPTSKTPVFNNFYDVPNGVGNEADFVRVKPKAGTNADYVSTLSAACNVGDSYNVRTYIHNGADPAGNGNGNGVAVARNVVLAMTAPLKTDGSNFNFTSKITASNAATVSDTGVIMCGNKTVRLELVPSSVQTYSKFLGFQTVSDGAVNGTLKIGSRVQGSGDQWACWEDRVIVVYEVKVVEIPTPPPVVSTGVCKAPAVIVNNNKREATVTVNSSTKNATVVGYEIDWGDGTAKSTSKTATHQYAKDGSYTIVTRVQIKFADGTTKWVNGSDCNYTITIKKPVEKVPYCESLKIDELGDRRVKVLANINANSTTLKTVRYTFGDGSAAVTTNAGRAAEHKYAQDGSFTIAATTLVYETNGATKTITIDCTGQVTFTTPPVTPPVTPPTPEVPEELPRTGAGSVIASIFGISLVAMIAHRLFLSRRLSR